MKNNLQRYFLIAFGCVLLGTFSPIMAQPKIIPPEVIAEFYEFIKKNSLPLDHYLLNSKDLSVFVKTLQLSGDFTLLEGDNEYTVFAPSNSAFEQFPTEVLTELFDIKNKEKLQSIVRYHIATGTIQASDIIRAIDSNSKNEAKYQAINGLYLTMYYDEDDLFIKDDNGYSIKITQQDILLSNGIVFKIDTIILPQVDNRENDY